MPDRPTGTLLFDAGYSGGPWGLAQRTGNWQTAQVPNAPGADGPRQDGRITVVKGGAVPPGGPTAALRVELRPYETLSGAANGDVQSSGGFLASRAEVYARHAVPGSTPPEQWPDPVGSTRWYAFKVFWPVDVWLSADSADWLLLTQWKGFRTGSPPLALEVSKGRFKLAGSSRHDLGGVVRGRWTSFVFGFTWSPDAATGAVTVLRDGQLVVPATPQATMKTTGGHPDPNYVKQGIYRSKRWTVTQVVWFSALRIGTTRAAAEGAS